MKPDWDKLAQQFKDSDNVLIADVDCTGEGEPLCKKHDVQGYPTIKTILRGRSKGETYNGARDFKSLKKHANSIGPPWYEALLKRLEVRVALALVVILIVYIAGQVVRLW